MKNVLFFDGTNIEEVKFLFTRNHGKRKRLRRFDTVVRELSLLKKPKLVNRTKKRVYHKHEIPEKIVRRKMPVVFDEERRTFQRPPAVYDNHSREELINKYLAQ